MITNETPLTEIVRHLPVEAARVLDAMPQQVQTDVLTVVRGCLVYWQKGKYTFDPITKEGVLNALVLTQATLCLELHQRELEITALRKLLKISDGLLRRRRGSREGGSDG